MTELAGKTALVAGAAGGIGRAIAAALRAEGATVMGADLHPAEADHIIVGDLTDAQFCDTLPARAADTMGRLDMRHIHPVGRTGMPEGVASLVAWLGSDKSGFVTGQVWNVDGGRMSKISLP